MQSDDYNGEIMRNPNCIYVDKCTCRGCPFSSDPSLYDGCCLRRCPPDGDPVPWAEGEQSAQSGSQADGRATDDGPGGGGSEDGSRSGD